MESLFIGLVPPKEISFPLIQWVNQMNLIPEKKNPFFPQIPLALCPSGIKRIDLTRYIEGSPSEISFSPFKIDESRILSIFIRNELFSRFDRFREQYGFPDGLEYFPGYQFPFTTNNVPENITSSRNWFLHLNTLDTQPGNHSYRWSLLEKINIRREV